MRRTSTRTAPVAKHNGQYADLTARPVENQTQTDCAGPLECLPAAPGVPQHFAYQDSGNKPPPTNAG